MAHFFAFCTLFHLSLTFFRPQVPFKLRLQDASYRLRFHSSSLIHTLSLSNSHSNVASIQKNRGDKSHCVIVALKEASTGRTLSSFNPISVSLLGTSLSSSNANCDSIKKLSDCSRKKPKTCIQLSVVFSSFTFESCGQITTKFCTFSSKHEGAGI